MRKTLLLAAALVAMAGSAAYAGCPGGCHTGRVAARLHHPTWNEIAAEQAAGTPWHGSYYNVEWGAPVALVVPPTAEMQTNWGWGVTNTRVTPIWNQFQRGYPGPYSGGPGGMGFYPTPLIPSDTTQFGVYYVRGPW